MKNILLFTIAALFLTSVPLFAHHEEKIRLMKELAKELKGKSINQPVELTKAWHKLHGEKIDLITQELEKMKAQLPTKGQAKYEAVINTLGTLKSQMENLPIPAKGFKKDFSLLPEWMKLKKQMFKLKGQELDAIAEQTGIPAAEKLAALHHKIKDLYMKHMDNAKDVMSSEMAEEKMEM